jgi:hypothetical protein
MSDAASLAAAPADRDEPDAPFDVESAADAIERLLDPGDEPRRRNAAPGAADGTAAATGDGEADEAQGQAGAAEPRLRVRLGEQEREMSLSELAALAALQGQLGEAAVQADGAAPAIAMPPMPDPSWQHEAQAQQLAAVIPALQQRLQLFAGINWERMAAEDPALFAQARPAYEALGAQLAEAEAAAFALSEQQAQTRAAVVAHTRRLDEERQALAGKVPEFADPQRAPREAAALLGYLAKAGYGAAEIDGLTDHRHVVLARKAMLYDRLMEGRASGRVREGAAARAGAGQRAGAAGRGGRPPRRPDAAPQTQRPSRGRRAPHREPDLTRRAVPWHSRPTPSTATIRSARAPT